MTTMMLNDFTIDIDAESKKVFDMLNQNQKDEILLHYIKFEVNKKQNEIRKNYKDVNKFLVNTFSSKVYERLIKKVLLSSLNFNNNDNNS